MVVISLYFQITQYCLLTLYDVLLHFDPVAVYSTAQWPRLLKTGAGTDDTPF